MDISTLAVTATTGLSSSGPTGWQSVAYYIILWLTAVAWLLLILKAIDYGHRCIVVSVSTCVYYYCRGYLMFVHCVNKKVIPLPVR